VRSLRSLSLLSPFAEHLLTSLPLADGLSYSLVTLDDPTPEQTLAGPELARTWVETELVEALYTKGRESETLVRSERVVVVPA